MKENLDRYKDENEELRGEMAEITRRYLVEKSKVEEIRARMEIGPQTNKREIEKLV